MRVPYRIVVEPQEADLYGSVIDRAKVLVLPFSNLGQGSVPARNWVWDHSREEGARRHWILDDNISAFYRFNKNAKVMVKTGATFAAAEDFVDRYSNAPMAGMNYHTFVDARSDRVLPVRINTRVYSCLLLSNSVNYRWRGRYNEDTDLSLRILKSGFCTILFNAFLADKVHTMTMSGGNTDQLYKQDSEFDGRLAMAQSLQRQHPDVTTIVRKWGRWQHQVDYRPFKGNRLIRRKDVDMSAGVNNYGMKLKKR